MHIDELKKSKYLTKSDCGTGILVTIDRVEQANVAKDNEKPELRWLLFFVEIDKPLILNSVNGQTIALITGSRDSAPWPGHKIVLFEEPSVVNRGQVVGGIRVRAPKKKAAAPAPVQQQPTRANPPPPPAPMEDEEEQDDVPF